MSVLLQRLLIPTLLSCLLLSACVGGSGGDDDSTPPVGPTDPTDPTPPTSIPLGEAGETSYAHMLEYLDVVLDPANFDECLTTDLETEWYKCIPGPRTGHREAILVDMESLMFCTTGRKLENKKKCLAKQGGRTNQ